MNLIDDELEKCDTIEKLINLASLVNQSIDSCEKEIKVQEQKLRIFQKSYDNDIVNLNNMRQTKIKVMQKLQQYLSLKAFI